MFPKFIFKQMFPSFSKLSYEEAKDKIDPKDIDAVKRMNSRQRSGDGFMIDLKQVNEITRRELEIVKCPTFIMHSKYDRSVNADHSYFANEHIPSSKLCLLNSWGHLIWLGTSGDETDRRLLSFLQSQPISNEC